MLCLCLCVCVCTTEACRTRGIAEGQRSVAMAQTDRNGRGTRQSSREPVLKAPPGVDLISQTWKLLSLFDVLPAARCFKDDQ